MSKRAFEEEILAAIPMLRRVARKWARNKADADDLVQSAVCKAFMGRMIYHEKFNMEAWLLVVMKNQMVDWYRVSRRLVYGEGHLGGSWEPDFGDPVLVRRLKKLKPAYLEVLVLVDVGGWTYREVAEALSVPMGTVMSRLYRARASLRDILEKEK